MTFHDNIPSNLLDIPTLPLQEVFDQSLSSIVSPHLTNPNPNPKFKSTAASHCFCDRHVSESLHHCLHLTINAAPHLHLQPRSISGTHCPSTASCSVLCSQTRES